MNVIIKLSMLTTCLGQIASVSSVLLYQRENNGTNFKITYQCIETGSMITRVTHASDIGAISFVVEEFHLLIKTITYSTNLKVKAMLCILAEGVLRYYKQQ